MNLNLQFRFRNWRFVQSLGPKIVNILKLHNIWNNILKLEFVIQSALIPTSARFTTKQPSVATGSLDARPLNSWAVVPASKALTRFPANCSLRG